MNSVIQSKQKEHGQSMVELALTITILMVLLAGTIDFGRAFFTWLAMRDAAQEGASYGSIKPPSGDITCDPSAPNLVCARVYANLIDVDNEWQKDFEVKIYIIDHPCIGNTIKVDVKYPEFKLTMPFLGIFIGNSIPIHATVNDAIILDSSSCH
jgi:hypothetical protein